MDNSLRSPIINLAGAIIIGASLIISASIVAHKPQALGAPSTSVREGVSSEGTVKAAPPIAQDAVASQFREQVLNSPEVRTRKTNGRTYTLTDVKVKQVIYSAKEDTFTVIYHWIWDRPMPRPDVDADTLNNDGYGHYYGSASFGGMDNGGFVRSTEVTIR